MDNLEEYTSDQVDIDSDFSVDENLSESLDYDVSSVMDSVEPVESITEFSVDDSKDIGVDTVSEIMDSCDVDDLEFDDETSYDIEDREVTGYEINQEGLTLSEEESERILEVEENDIDAQNSVDYYSAEEISDVNDVSEGSYDESDPKILTRDPNELWETGNAAIENTLDAMRDDLRDKGIEDGEEMEAMIEHERDMLQDELSRNIGGDLEYHYDEPEWNEESREIEQPTEIEGIEDHFGTESEMVGGSNALDIMDSVEGEDIEFDDDIQSELSDEVSSSSEEIASEVNGEYEINTDRFDEISDTELEDNVAGDINSYGEIPIVENDTIENDNIENEMTETTDFEEPEWEESSVVIDYPEAEADGIISSGLESDLSGDIENEDSEVIEQVDSYNLDSNEIGSDIDEGVDEINADEALSNMSEYMNRHNYGLEDYATYSQDPEWQALNRDLQSANEINDSSESVLDNIDHGEERIYDDFEQSVLETHPDFYETGSFYMQGINSHGFEGTCGPTSQANAINKLFETNELTENKVLDIAVNNNLCNLEGPAESCGGTTTDQFMELYDKVNEQMGDCFNTELFEFDNALDANQVADRLDAGDVINVAVDSSTLWNQKPYGIADLLGVRREVISDHWITVTGVNRGESGEIQGFDIIDSGGGENYVSLDKYNDMCFGSGSRIVKDPTCIVLSKK